MTAEQKDRLVTRLTLRQLRGVLLFWPVIPFLLSSPTLAAGGTGWLWRWLWPAAILLFGALGPWLALQFQLSAHAAGTAPVLSVQDAVALPRRLSRSVVVVHVVGAGVVLLVGLGGALGTGPGLAALTTVVLLAILNGGHTEPGFERLLRPFVVEAFHARAEASGGVRRSWEPSRGQETLAMCLPVLTGFAVVGALGVGFTVDATVAGPPLAAWVWGAATFLVAASAWTAAEISRERSEGAAILETSLASLGAGRPRLPAWVGPDELGDMAVALGGAVMQLRSFSTTLAESTGSLGRTAEALDASNAQQSQMLSSQAAALQETQITAQEIRQTSLLAAQKADTVLAQTEKADQISRSGESAIEQSLTGLTDIRSEVMEMAAGIRALDERARQIATITGTVKELADQSNMLALNAAIEAVRSGEQGKGFAVVAREIRSLADQSIEATENVREILQDIGEAIRSTAHITERGSEKVERSLEQVRTFGDNMRQLSGIVRESAASVRQISAAVTQQNAGIGQIFQAVNDLNKMMEQTLERLKSSDGVTGDLRDAVRKVAAAIGRFEWGTSSNVPPRPPSA